MFIRSRAPLRLGLGGGGTDLDAYSSKYGGCVVSASINLFTHCILKSIDKGVSFVSRDKQENTELLDLHQAIYKRVCRDWNHSLSLPISIETFSDVEPGSGLGSSSSLVTAQLIAYARLLRRNMTQAELANMSYSIERIELGMSGGRQDQWASAMGGINFFEFLRNGQVNVSPLLIDLNFLDNLANHIILFDTGIPRCSMELSRMQVVSTASGDPHTLDSLHSLKADALFVREILSKGDLESFASSLRRSWEAKKQLALGITNQQIEKIYETGINAGALAGKVAGAGGGGYMLFLVKPENHDQFEKSLAAYGGKARRIKFTSSGAQAWELKEPELWSIQSSP